MTPGTDTELNALDAPDQRLDTFVDAAFAFALTMLVVSIDEIPRSLPALYDVLRGIPAFGVSFILLTIFWLGHRRWRAEAGHRSPPATAWSLALVFSVMVFLYPLKMMFAAFFFWISAGYFPSPFDETSPASMPPLFAIFGFAMAAMSGCLAGLTHSSCQRSPTLALRQARLSWLLITLVALLVGLVAALAPIAIAIWTPMVFFALFFSRPISNWLLSRSPQRASDQEHSAPT